MFDLSKYIGVKLLFGCVVSGLIAGVTPGGIIKTVSFFICLFSGLIAAAILYSQYRSFMDNY